MTDNQDSLQNALAILKSLPSGDERLLEACRKLGEITNELQSVMAAQTSLQEACELVEERGRVGARRAASFMIEILRLAHNL